MNNVNEVSNLKDKPIKKRDNVGLLINKLDLIDHIPKVFAKKIITKIINADGIPSDNSKLLRLCLDLNRLDLIDQFSESAFTDNIIEEYGAKIVDYGKIPSCLSDNSKLLRLCLDLKRFDLIDQFSDSAFTDSIIEKYSAKIEIPPYYHYPIDNSKLLRLCLDLNRLDLIDLFSGSAFTDSIIEKYGAKIVDYGKIPSCLSNNSKLLRLCLDLNRLDLIDLFSGSAFTDSIIEKYGAKIVDYGKIPSCLSNNSKLLRLCFDLNRLDLINKFSESAFTDSIIEEYGAKIVDYGKIYGGIPSCLRYNSKYNSKLLRLCFDLNRLDLIDGFDDSAFTDSIIEEYGAKIVDYGKIPYGLVYNSKLLGLCFDLNRLDLINRFGSSAFTDSIIEKYGAKIVNNIKQFGIESVYYLKGINKNSIFADYLLKNKEFEIFDAIFFSKPFKVDILTDKESLEVYSQYLGISTELLTLKIQTLMSKNNEILQTLYPKMLSDKFNGLNLKYIERIAIYPDLQEKIIGLNDKEIILLEKIFELLDNENFDMYYIIYNIINNFDKYADLINSVNLSTLTQEVLENLLYVLRDENIKLILPINSQMDLKFLSEYRNEYFENIDGKISNSEISINELKIAIFEKRYGLSIEMADFIIKRYCGDLDKLKSYTSKDNELDAGILNILIDISNIFNSNNIDELTFIWNVSEKVDCDLFTSLSLESAIRKEYAQLYNKSLYKVKREHLINDSHYLSNTNRPVFDLINQTTYNDKNIKFYLVDGDFSMQIHALGAYSAFQKPDNYKEVWERPLISYHGICTSYIANNLIATAKSDNPIYGFNHYEESALLCAGNYDLNSNDSNLKFASSLNKPYNFYPPKLMIDKTRHSHNEFVIERRDMSKNSNFKREPDYIVYVIDDINNEANFSSDNEKYQEIVKAAANHNIPIVIVDRLKYALSEFQKCKDLEEEFYNTMDGDVLYSLLTRYCDNIVSCSNYGKEADAKYHMYFTEQGLEVLLDELINYSKDATNTMKQLYNICENDAFLKKFTLRPEFAVLSNEEGYSL